MNEVPKKAVQIQSADPSVPATTTFQEDLVTAGQRDINKIWEWTQAIIAILVSFACMVVATYDGVTPASAVEFPAVLSNAFFLIIGFYFSRTNHQNIGGEGKKPGQKYEGR